MIANFVQSDKDCGVFDTTLPLFQPDERSHMLCSEHLSFDLSRLSLLIRIEGVGIALSELCVASGWGATFAEARLSFHATKVESECGAVAVG